jgi:hypothetical protein
MEYPPSFPDYNFVCVHHLPLAAYMAHSSLILFDFIDLIIFVLREEYKL